MDGTTMMMKAFSHGLAKWDHGNSFNVLAGAGLLWKHHRHAHTRIGFERCSTCATRGSMSAASGSSAWA